MTYAADKKVLSVSGQCLHHLLDHIYLGLIKIFGDEEFTE